MREVLLMGLIGCVGFVCSAKSSETTGPRVFLINANRLLEVRARVAAADPSLKPAMDKLTADAEAALENGPFSVTDKPMTPPSGDKHDYMSVGPYWWPNPDTEDGLPYVRRDGETNPERHKYDNVALGAMSSAVQTLGLAWFLTGEERYAQHAATLLRVWFLDDATRMNPNLKYGQAIPGRVEGRGTGIIDTGQLPRLLDAVGMLQGSEAWTGRDQQGLQSWFSMYLDWLLTHPYGKEERRAANNHGTWYDMQAVAYALFADRSELAREILEAVPQDRIDRQFEPDGRQPRELARTKSYSYSVMNLSGFFSLAVLGERFGIDLWDFRTEDGRSMRTGLDWILEHAFGGGEWEYQNLSPVKPEPFLPLLRMAAVAYEEPAYEQKLQELAGGEWDADRFNLLCSALPSTGGAGPR